MEQETSSLLINLIAGKDLAVLRWGWFSPSKGGDVNGWECGLGPKLPRFDLQKLRVLGGSPWARHSASVTPFLYL